MYYNDSFALSWCNKTLFFTIVHNDTSIVGLLKLIDKVEFYYEHGSPNDHPLLGGDFPQNVCQMPGISGKIDHSDWCIYILSLYFYVCVCIKIFDQEKIYRYKFLLFSGALGWHVPTPNTPLWRCARSDQSQTQKLLRLALVHLIGLSDSDIIWVWQVLPNRKWV